MQGTYNVKPVNVFYLRNLYKSATSKKSQHHTTNTKATSKGFKSLGMRSKREFCEHDNELPASVKTLRLLVDAQVCKCQLPKEDPTL